MANIDLSKLSTLNTQNLPLSRINSILDNATVLTSFTGKRTIIFGQSNYSLQNQYALGKTSFEALTKTLADNLHKYPISLSQDIKNVSVINRFDLTPKMQFEKYKSDIEQAESIVEKLRTLDKLSKENVKKANFITRIFFFFTQLFAKVFSFNLTRADKYLLTHKKIIEQKEILLKPFSKYHIANIAFNATSGLMLVTNIFLQMFRVNIPYVSKTLNVATMITYAKVISSQVSNALSQV